MEAIPSARQKVGMFQQPSIADYERMLDAVLAEDVADAAREAAIATTEMVQAGALESGRNVHNLAQRSVPVHRRGIEHAMQVTLDMARSGIALPDLLTAAEPRLRGFEHTLLNKIETVARRLAPGAIDGLRADFAARTDRAMSDLKVGFIGGRSVDPGLADTTQAKALRLLKAIYDETLGREQPTFANEVAARLQMTEIDGRAAFAYLIDKGLVKTFPSMPLAAAVNATGVDAIERARQRPDQPSASFPDVTLNNVINVYAPVGQVQQGTSASTQSQSIEGDSIERVRAVLELLKRDLQCCRASRLNRTYRGTSTRSRRSCARPSQIAVSSPGRCRLSYSLV